MLRQHHSLMVSGLTVLDGLVAAGAAMLAWIAKQEVYGLAYPVSWESYFKNPLVLFIAPVVVWSLSVFRLYRPRRDRRIIDEIGQIFKASWVSMAVLLVLLWAVDHSVLQPSESVRAGEPMGLLWRPADDNRFQLAALALFLPLLLSVERTTIRLGLRRLRSMGRNKRHAAVIGTGRLGQVVARMMERHSWTGVEIAYFASHHDGPDRSECLGRPVIGGIRDLGRVLSLHPVDMVYVALPARRADELPRVLSQLQTFSGDVKVIPDVPLRYLPNRVVLEEFSGMPIMTYRESPTRGVHGFAKRVFDIFGASVGLLVFAVPMLLIAMLVRRSGPGPVIFRQKRVSLGGEQFEIFKFRTMHHVEDEDPLGGPERPGHGWTRRDDPRITRIGRWLRRTSLDELPQLFNVLSGEMSLVGPRPERPELIERFKDDWRGYILRQQVKAGMTGWAQVHGLRGDTSLRRRLRYDLFYIRNWSLWLDLRIVVMTVWRGFVHQNAI